MCVVKDVLQKELNNARDNLWRARRRFDGADLNEEYGQSGRTRAEILHGYRQTIEELEEALRDHNTETIDR
jgi:predicted ribosome quality control (RQC) complex YloA/Tae2 family protein